MTPKNYIEAVKEILNGNPVENLDELKIDYNKKYQKFNSSISKNYKPQIGISPLGTVVSFTADAENKILLGKSPDEIYHSFGKSTEEFRKSGRKILENWLDKSIHDLIL